MGTTIGQRELRNDNAEIIRRVEAGETFTVTRNGMPIADLVPHDPRSAHRRSGTLGELQERVRRLPRIDVDQWYADRAETDKLFAGDCDDEDPWQRQARRNVEREA